VCQFKTEGRYTLEHMFGFKKKHRTNSEESTADHDTPRSQFECVLDTYDFESELERVK
jgi:hypothetical protein